MSNSELDISVDVKVINPETPNPETLDSNEETHQLNTGLVRTRSRNNNTQ